MTPGPRSSIASPHFGNEAEENYLLLMTIRTQTAQVSAVGRRELCTFSSSCVINGPAGRLRSINGSQLVDTAINHMDKQENMPNIPA